MPDLTIVIPVWNHWQTTAKCLISIFKSEVLPYTYKIIVVDDESTDLTPGFLKHLQEQNLPIEVLRNEKNLGYTLSLNRGIKATDSKYILVTNNDIFLDKFCILNLLKTFEKYPDMGLLGATQYDADWNELVPLKFFLRGEKAVIRDHIISSNIPKDLINSEIIYTDIVNIACTLTSKDVIDKVGVYDEQFSPANYDQEDWCLRMKEAGLRVAICPKAKFIHYPATTVIDKMPEYSRALDENRIKFFKKWGEKLKENKIWNYPS